MEVLNLLEAGEYETEGRRVSIRDAQRQSEEGTKLYRPEDVTRLSEVISRGAASEILVEDSTTQVAASQLSSEGLALLNFASARNPGGGFLNGAKAQEEDLCRCSGLYPTLLRAPEYYEANRGQDSMIYTDHAIYSPAVVFFRTSGRDALLPEPFTADVITMPAPNTGPYLRRKEGGPAELQAAFDRRWRAVLDIARDNDVKTLILGAWGCGAFQGDAEQVAQSALLAACERGHGLRLIFAIPNRGKRSAANFETFRQVLTSRV